MLSKIMQILGWAIWSRPKCPEEEEIPQTESTDPDADMNLPPLPNDAGIYFNIFRTKAVTKRISTYESYTRFSIDPSLVVSLKTETKVGLRGPEIVQRTEDGHAVIRIIPVDDRNEQRLTIHDFRDQTSYTMFQNDGTVKGKNGTIFITRSGDSDAYPLWAIHVSHREKYATVEEISSRRILCVIDGRFRLKYAKYIGKDRKRVKVMPGADISMMTLFAGSLHEICDGIYGRKQHSEVESGTDDSNSSQDAAPYQA